MIKENDINWKTILKYNLRFTFSINVILSVGIMILGMILFKIFSINRPSFERMCEYFLIFMVPASVQGIGDYECVHRIWEFVFTKKASYYVIYFFRLFILLVFNALLFAIPYSIMAVRSSETVEISLLGGVFITSVWLGLLGLFFLEWTGSRQLSFGIIIVYYLFEALMKGRVSGPMQLMGYTNGNPGSKANLAIGCLILFVVLFVILIAKVRGLYGNRDRGTV